MDEVPHNVSASEPPIPCTTRGQRLRRLLNVLFFCAAVVLSLLTFPGSVPGMIAGWLALSTWLILRGRSGILPGVVCAAIVLVKHGLVTPAMWAVLLFGVFAPLAIRYLTGRGVIVHRRRFVGAIAGTLWILWAGMAWDWHSGATCGRRIVVAEGRTIVCLGDSLTAPEKPFGGYPRRLAEMLSLPVVNLGQAGISSGEALRQLPALAAANPAIVVIELGGHDFLKGHGRQSARRNIETIIREVRKLGAEPILMEIPRGFIVDPFGGLERELAREYNLQLVGDEAIRKLIFWSPYAPPGIWTGGPYLSNDGLHPNERGEEWLAGEVAIAVRAIMR